MSTAVQDVSEMHRNDEPRRVPSSSSHFTDEKHPIDTEKSPLEERFDDHDVSKPFPVDPDYVEETHQLTVRAVVVGCVLGVVVGASNIYLGLKTGFTFGASLFGAIFGFAIIKAIVKAVPDSGILGKLFGGEFGPKENVTVQTAATAAGGLGILFVSAIPAMYRLELLNTPREDFGRLCALTFCCAFFGLFFAIPLRKYFIIRQKLTFPTPAATAYTIRSLHSGAHGALIAKKKALCLLWSLVASFCYKVVSGYAPGLIFDWHIGWTLYRLGFTSIIALENHGWFIEFTPAFFGAGMLSGLNASWSFFGGSILAWGIIAPAIVKNELAFGSPISEEFPLVSYNALSFADPDKYVDHPSPRYWLLWPGVLIMLVYSFVDIFVTLIPVAKEMWATQRSGSGFNPNPMSWFRKGEVDAESEDDVFSSSNAVPTSWWVGGLAVSIIMSCAILATLWGLNVGEALLALILGFLFSFIGVQSSGYTDINPISTVAKASQLVFGGIGKGKGLTGKPAESYNLVAGTIAGGTAAQAVDMTGDLKTGYLLHAKPRNQLIAQFIGSIVAVFLSVGLFVLFTQASPCILIPPEDGKCTYGAPSVAAWAAVAVAVSAPRLPVPPSSGYTAIGLAIASALTVVLRQWFIPKRFWAYVPNWNAIGLAFVVPQLFYSIAMAAGSTFCYIWQKRSPGSYDMYMFALSAGLLAGEGLGGVFQALLAVLKVDGSRYGTAIGCPGFEFCG